MFSWSQCTYTRVHSHPQVTDAHIEVLYTLARCKFDCGKYVDAANYLYHFRLLSKDEEKCYLAAWGKVAAEVLLYADAETSKSDLQELRELIDKKVTIDAACVV